MHKIQPGGWPSAFWHLVKCHHLLFIHAIVYVNLVFVGLYLFPETTLLPDVNIFHFGMLLFKECNATLFSEFFSFGCCYLKIATLLSEFSSFGCCYLKNAVQLSLENSHHWDVAIWWNLILSADITEFSYLNMSILFLKILHFVVLLIYRIWFFILKILFFYVTCPFRK